jgi:hypothetical protein
MADTCQNFHWPICVLFYRTEKGIAAYGSEDITLSPPSRLFPRNCLLFKIIRENDGLTVLSEILALISRTKHYYTVLFRFSVGK